MSDDFFDEEEDDAGEWGIKFPRSSEVEDILFAFEYRFPSAWAEIMTDIEANGMVMGGFIITSQMAIDAMRTGFIAPIYTNSENGEDGVYFKFWSSLAFAYLDFHELDELEVDWLFNALVYKIWSYN
jgi:hypothetical protein